MQNIISPSAVSRQQIWYKKETWASIIEILCKTRKIQGGIKSIIPKGKRIDDQRQIVEHFNSFLINIGPSLISKSTPPKNKNFRMYLNKAILTSFNFTLIDNGILGKTLHSLRTKTSAGHDGISVKLLNFLFPAVSKPLCLVINQPLLTGIYPDKLRIAKVIPLFKKDDTLLMDNYYHYFLLFRNYSRKAYQIKFQNISWKITYSTMDTMVLGTAIPQNVQI